MYADALAERPYGAHSYGTHNTDDDGRAISTSSAWLLGHDNTHTWGGRKSLLMAPFVKKIVDADISPMAACIALASLYGLVTILACIQLVRTHRRLSRGVTKQKVFFVCTGINALVRTTFFTTIAIPSVNVPLFLSYAPHVDFALTVVNNLPGYVFFSTYCLLIVYWAEIVDRVRNPSYSLNVMLHPAFIGANVLVYVVEIAIWILWGVFGDMKHETQWTVAMIRAQMLFFAAVSLAAALGFVFFGGRLVLLLRRVDRVSGGQRGVYNEVLQRRLREVMLLTVICTLSFLVRAALVLFCEIEGQPDDENWPVCERTHIFVLCYYCLSEIVPSTLLLYILRELPRRNDGIAPSPHPSPSASPLPANTTTLVDPAASPAPTERSPLIVK